MWKYTFLASCASRSPACVGPIPAIGQSLARSAYYLMDYIILPSQAGGKVWRVAWTRLLQRKLNLLCRFQTGKCRHLWTTTCVEDNEFPWVTSSASEIHGTFQQNALREPALCSNPVSVTLEHLLDSHCRKRQNFKIRTSTGKFSSIKTYRQLLWLLVKVTSRLDGFWPEGEPVGCEGSDGAHPHEGVGGQPADVLPQLVQLGNPQLSQDFLSLHDCCSLVTLRAEREASLQSVFWEEIAGAASGWRDRRMLYSTCVYINRSLVEGRGSRTKGGKTRVFCLFGITRSPTQPNENYQCSVWTPLIKDTVARTGEFLCLW